MKKVPRHYVRPAPIYVRGWIRRTWMRGDIRVPPRWLPYSLVGLGVVLWAILLVELLAEALEPDPFSVPFVGSVVSSLPFSILLVAGGYWLARSDITETHYRRIAGWTLAGVSFFVCFLGIMAVFMFDGWWAWVATIRWSGSIGAGGGLLVGLFEARAIAQAIAAERIRAEEVERRRDLLNYLNALLRHEVLNTANTIKGYAALLEETDTTDGSEEDYASIIQRQADELSTVTQDVRVLLEATEESSPVEPKNLSTVVRDDLRKLQDRYEAVRTELHMPDDVYVLADVLLHRLFSNLFENAVEHNDSATPCVSVTGTTSTETVTVRVEDNGPGVPKDERADLFERTSEDGTDHGLGLAIVETLSDRYGGSVELTQTRAAGSVFTVELPRTTERPSTARPVRTGVSHGDNR